MFGRLGSVVAIALMATSMFCGFAAAAEWRVAKLSGQVVVRSGPLQGVSLTSGMVLKSGSVLVADKTGHALLVHGGDQMIVSPSSMVAVPNDRGGIPTRMARFRQ